MKSRQSAVYSFFDIFDIVKHYKFSNDEKKNRCRQLENE